jgi:putative salt-induced outer membrane protein YdiY
MTSRAAARRERFMIARKIRDRSGPVIHLSLLLALPSFFLPLASADEVLISDGSRIIGEVVRHDTEVLKLKTSFAGTLEIDWAEVEEVKLTEPGTVLLAGGQTLEIEALSRAGDRFILYPVSSTDPVSIEASRVTAFEPEPWELGRGHKQTGRINLAIEDESGNSEKREWDLDLELHNRWNKNHLSVFGQLEYDTTRGLTSTDKWGVFANLDHTFTGQWYYSGALLVRQDRFKDLKLRTSAGPAIGYRFFDTTPLKLRTEVGLYYLKDDFYDQVDESFWGPGWYLEYEQQVWKRRLQLYHRHVSLAAANESGKYIWRSWTGLRAPLIAGFIASVEYEIDYDSEPAVEVETTDTTFKLKLGYEWK